MDRSRERTIAEIYAEVAAKHQAEQKSVPADSGPRGLTVTDLEDSEEFKAGPLEQVAADIAQRQANGTWRAGCFDSVP